MVKRVVDGRNNVVYSTLLRVRRSNILSSIVKFVWFWFSDWSKYQPMKYFLRRGNLSCCIVLASHWSQICSLVRLIDWSLGRSMIGMSFRSSLYLIILFDESFVLVETRHMDNHHVHVWNCRQVRWERILSYWFDHHTFIYQSIIIVSVRRKCVLSNLYIKCVLRRYSIPR